MCVWNGTPSNNMPPWGVLPGCMVPLCDEWLPAENKSALSLPAKEEDLSHNAQPTTNHDSCCPNVESFLVQGGARRCGMFCLDPSHYATGPCGTRKKGCDCVVVALRGGLLGLKEDARAVLSAGVL